MNLRFEIVLAWMKGLFQSNAINIPKNDSNASQRLYVSHYLLAPF